VSGIFWGNLGGVLIDYGLLIIGAERKTAGQWFDLAHHKRSRPTNFSIHSRGRLCHTAGVLPPAEVRFFALQLQPVRLEFNDGANERVMGS